jgi:hypothetical protein
VRTERVECSAYSCSTRELARSGDQEVLDAHGERRGSPAAVREKAQY